LQKLAWRHWCCFMAAAAVGRTGCAILALVDSGRWVLDADLPVSAIPPRLLHAGRMPMCFQSRRAGAAKPAFGDET
jgi:hypothetical protein